METESFPNSFLPRCGTGASTEPGLEAPIRQQPRHRRTAFQPGNFTWGGRLFHVSRPPPQAHRTHVYRHSLIWRPRQHRVVCTTRGTEMRVCVHV